MHTCAHKARKNRPYCPYCPVRAVTDIRWVIVRPNAPLGGKDVILAEFTAPDRRAARLQLTQSLNAGDVPAGSVVMSRVEFATFQYGPPKDRRTQFRRKRFGG